MAFYNNQKKTEGDHLTPEPENEEVKQDIAKVDLIFPALSIQAKTTNVQGLEDEKSGIIEDIPVDDHRHDQPLSLEIVKR